MKIVFTIKALNDAKGGAERVLADVASGLAEEGHEIIIISFDAAGHDSFYPLSPKIRRVCLDIGDALSKATLVEFVQRVIAIRREVQEIKPDIVVGFMHSSFIPASFALIGTGIPVIASEHIVPDHYKHRKLEYFLVVLSSFFTNKMTVLSKPVLEKYPRILHSKMVVMENPVHPANDVIDWSDKSEDTKRILNVGRLTEQKDQKTLIEAFALLADDYPDWSVKILGDGELYSELSELIGSLGLEQRIELADPVSDIEREYQNSHIFALPSLYESFGLATAEAMSHGLPVIGFDTCPGTNELIIDNENGFLVDGKNRVEAFSEGLRRLISDDDLRRKLGQNGPQTIEPFHPPRIVAKWSALIRDVSAL